MKPVIKTNYNYTRGLGLYLPKHYSKKWELDHKIDDRRMVKIEMPLAMARALYETVSALTAEDVGNILGRYVGMNHTIANWINRDLNEFVTMMYAQGMRPRLKPDVEPASWKKSKAMGWDDIKR